MVRTGPLHPSHGQMFRAAITTSLREAPVASATPMTVAVGFSPRLWSLDIWRGAWRQPLTNHTASGYSGGPTGHENPAQG